MGIITKGMGVIMKSKMKKAGVTKPTFPGPRATEARFCRTKLLRYSWDRKLSTLAIGMK